MPLSKITFKPGVVDEVSPYAQGNGYIDSNLVRWRDGFPETIGGWSQIGSAGQVLGICREIKEFSSNFGSLYLALGTNLKLYLMNSDFFYDVTPQRPAIALAPNPFTTVANPLQLKVTVPGHNCIANDFVTFSGAASSCGNYSAGQLNAQFQVASVVDLSTLLLTGTISAGTAGQTGGGAFVVATPDIQTGPQDASVATGFGIGAYGTGTFGTVRTPGTDSFSQIILQPRIWHIDNFGQDLILNPAGGGIYIWRQQGGLGPNRATLLSADPRSTDVPLYAAGIFVSVIDQNVVALGCSPLGSNDPDPMQIRWTDQANPYNWTPTSADAAGGYRLPSGSKIVGWLPTYYETLIWTDTTMYSMQFLGNSLVYGFNVLGKGFSIISPKAAISNGSVTLWMDRGSFYSYNGAVQELPCSVKARVFGNINTLQSWKIFAAHNHSFSEVWWFYPSASSTEIDSYVIFNYKDNLWSVGSLARTAWSDSGRVSSPISIDTAGNLLFHEVGTDAVLASGTSTLNSWVTTGDVDLNGGEQFLMLRRVIPDVTFTGSSPTNQQATMSIMTRDTSTQPRRTAKSVVMTPNPSNNGYIDVRVRGRRISLKIGSNKVGTGWRLGQFGADIAPSGRR